MPAIETESEPAVCTHVHHPVTEMAAGDHWCELYHDEGAHRELLSAFVRRGLELGHKVLFLTAPDVDATTDAVMSRLTDDGIDVGACRRRGQFSIVRAEESYVRGGVFIPERMLELWKQETSRAVDEGYSLLRATGEPTWALGSSPGRERLAEYEAQLNDFVAHHPCAIFCQYHCQRFPAQVLLAVLATHPVTLLEGNLYENFYYIPPQEFLGPDPAAASLRNCLRNLIARQKIEDERVASFQREQQMHRLVELKARQLAASNQELESFVHAVSHELHGPLRHFDGFCHMLSEHYAQRLDEYGQHYLERMRDGAKHMGRLLDDLLHLSRAGDRPLGRCPVDLNHLLEQARSELDLRERPIDWKIAALPVVECDPVLTQQVFVNLLSNAVKFTRGRTPAVIEVGADGSGPETVFFVRDNGAGFDPQYADRLFAPFQRLHPRDEFEGSGLGLATVRRIIARHGGEIWAKGAPGEGACFYFTLHGSPQKCIGRVLPVGRPQEAVSE